MKNKTRYNVKIKRRGLYRKSRGRKTVGAILLCILIIGLGFTGYAAGKPILEAIKRGGASDKSLEWTPSESEINYESASGDINSSGENNSTEKSEALAAEETNKISPKGKIKFVGSEAASNVAALSGILEKAKNDGAVDAVIELKTPDGKLTYKSDLSVFKTDEDARENIAVGLTSLSEIAAIFKNAGLKPTAKIYATRDALAPKYISGITYRFASDDWTWMDDAPENGGKQWSNPRAEETKNYLNDIVGEITSAGFDIIIAGLECPKFSNYDVSILPKSDTDESARRKSLAAIAKSLSDIAETNNAVVYFEASAVDLIEKNKYGYSAEFLKNLSGKINLALADLSEAANLSEVAPEIQISKIKTYLGSSVVLFPVLTSDMSSNGFDVYFER